MSVGKNRERERNVMSSPKGFYRLMRKINITCSRKLNVSFAHFPPPIFLSLFHPQFSYFSFPFTPFFSELCCVDEYQTQKGIFRFVFYQKNLIRLFFPSFFVLFPSFYSFFLLLLHFSSFFFFLVRVDSQKILDKELSHS